MKKALILRSPSLAVLLGLSLMVATSTVVLAQPATKKSDKTSAKSSPTPAKSDTASKKTEASTKVTLPDPVATVNGEKITKAELEEVFNKELQGAGLKADTLSSEQKIAAYHQIVDSMITDRLVEKQAAGIEVSQAEVDAELAKIKASFKTEQEFNDYLKQFKQTPATVQKEIKSALQWRKWFDAKIAGKDVVDEKEARKFYDENTKEFENPEMVRASHILILVPQGASEEVVKQKEAAAKKALARAQKGEDFTALAKELSEEPGAKESGGDLKFFDKTRMVPEFANAAFAQKVGEVGGPVRTQFGYHIIKVTDKKPAGTVTFDEAQKQLITYLQAEKRKAAVRTIIDDLRAKANVKVNLPPEPKPTAPQMAPGLGQ
ncbi:MAG: peptidylprolyl isomerase [Chthoniobacterales bacterium]